MPDPIAEARAALLKDTRELVSLACHVGATNKQTGQDWARTKMHMAAADRLTLAAFDLGVKARTFYDVPAQRARLEGSHED